MKNESKPYFSVVVPCYNVGYSVLQTLNSIKAQTFNNYEVILVNDGSTDNTQKILDSFQIAQKKTIVTQSNNGLGAARNSGIKICEGST